MLTSLVAELEKKFREILVRTHRNLQESVYGNLGHKKATRLGLVTTVLTQ